MNSKWRPQFFTIAIGQAVSLIGSSAVQFALIWWIASETNSPMMLGLSGLAAFLPTIIFSPLAGVLADRHSRKLLCIASDLFTGLVALVFAVMMWVRDVPVWSAVVILMLRGVGGTFQQPAITAIIPQLVPPSYLVKANGWTQMLQSGSFMLGPVIGAAMYAALPLPMLLLTDILGAAVASATLATVPVPHLDTQEHAHEPFWQNFKTGARVFLQDKHLLLMMAANTLCMVFFMPLSSFYPLMTSSYFNGSAWHGSVVELAFAVGMMISAALLGSVIEVKNKLGTAYLGLVGIGIASLVCGLVPPVMWGWWVFMIFCGMMGAFSNVFGIPLVAYMQQTIAPEKMGRAFSVFSLVGSLTMPLGLLIAGPVAEAIGVAAWFAVTGVACVIIAGAAWVVERRMPKAA